MTRKPFFSFFLAGVSILLPGVLSAQDAVTSSERIVVTGTEVEKTELSTKQAAAPASVSVLKYTEQQKRNTPRLH